MTAARWVPAVFESVKTPIGTGTVVSVATEWNGLFYKDSRVRAVVWYGTGSGTGWVSREWLLNELEPTP